MASPQLDNGHTRIANELLEAIYRSGFNGSQASILLLVIRYTYGFQRKSHDLSLTFISNATGIHKSKVQEYVKTLIEKNVIIVYSEATFNKPKEIGINKNYEQWELNSVQLPKQVTPTETGRVQLPKQVGVQLPKQVTKKERTKENYKEIYDYYMSLDLKKHRAYTDDMRKAIESAMKNNKYDIEYCKALLKRHREVVKATKNNDYPVKVRSLAEFFGQKVANAKHLICAEYEEGGKYYESYLKGKEDKPIQETRFVNIDDQVWGGE